MTASIRDDNPVVFFHHYLLTLEHGEVPEGEHVVPLGEAAVRREGGDVTIVALGWLLGKALAAAEQLAAEGVSAEVIDPRTLAPLDTATILESVEKTGRLVVVDQSTRHGSAAAVIAAEVASEGFSSLKAPIRLVTALDATIPYSQPMEEYLLPDEAKIVERRPAGARLVAGRRLSHGRPRGRPARRGVGLELLRTMWRIRVFEERVGELTRANEVHGLVHLSIGQEAVAAGVCGLLRDDDRSTAATARTGTRSRRARRSAA